MSRERSNGIDAGRDSLRWAVEKAERLEAENQRFNATILLVTKALNGDRDALRRLRRSGSCAPENIQPLIDATIKVLTTKPGEGDE